MNLNSTRNCFKRAPEELGGLKEDSWDGILNFRESEYPEGDREVFYKDLLSNKKCSFTVTEQ